MLIILFSMALATILVILVITLVLYFKDKNEVVETYIPQDIVKSIFETDIVELSERIATENLDEKTLIKLVDHVAKNFVFPPKNSTESNEPYLKFVYQFCMNPSAKGNTIVKMSNTLKTINRGYKRDIERIEKEAVRSRDNEASED